MRVSRFLMIVFLTTVGGDKRRWSWRENKTDSWRLIGRPIKETRRRSIDCLRHLSCLVLLIILVVFSSLAYAQSPPSKFEIERGNFRGWWEAGERGDNDRDADPSGPAERGARKPSCADALLLTFRGLATIGHAFQL